MIPGITINWAPYQFYTITNTDGTGAGGVLDPAIKNFCWDTDALDPSGRRIYPDGLYTITVRVFDTAGNSTWASEMRVENVKKSRIRR